VTWLQQLILAVSVTISVPFSASAGPCGNVAHVPEANVEHRAEGVDLNSGFSVDVSQLDVPVVVDVLRRPGKPGATMGETLIGIATTDGRTVTLQGPAVNEGQPVTLGPDCEPLEPAATPADR